MAIVSIPTLGSRRIALRGSFYVTARRGRLVAQSWPRPRKRRPPKPELDRREYFRALVEATRYMDPATQSYIADLTRGSATLARDLRAMMIAGTAFLIETADGRRFVPIRYRRVLHRALDRLGNHAAGIAARYADRWRTTGDAPAGYVLTSAGPGSPPTWAPLP